MSEEIRRTLNRRREEEGLPVLRQELLDADPVSASRLEPGDSSRTIRALEVYLGTGRPLSSYALPQRPREEFRCLLLGLKRERSELYDRINRRVDIMFEQGLREEVLSLIRKGASYDDPGMKGIGYSEFARLEENGCYTLRDVKEQIKQDSRRYAKRQMTFFRSLPGVEWFHPDDEEAIRKRIGVFRGNRT